ncbi:alpha-hydroxy-acid oxidizing protein [Streptomyces sp. NPDC005728]|uniref:alpha-hydroxy-acid oxidizing protein n=1 Tax=Streptomyces sp. NPDC005728 TaxID=3157054 RepID=UPI0033C718E1
MASVCPRGRHGGRRPDRWVPALDARPEVVCAVAGRCEVLIDGGIRRGSDVLVALALGARAALAGRPVLWGMAVSATEGLKDVLSILGVELETAMALCGRTALASVDSSPLCPAAVRSLRRRGGDRPEAAGHQQAGPGRGPGHELAAVKVLDDVFTCAPNGPGAGVALPPASRPPSSPRSSAIRSRAGRSSRRRP